MPNKEKRSVRFNVSIDETLNEALTIYNNEFHAGTLTKSGAVFTALREHQKIKDILKKIKAAK